MKISKTEINDLLLLKPTIFEDERGHFFESYNLNRISEAIGGEIQFVQDNHSFSKKGVLRGLHLQASKPQFKLVRCTRGKIFDVAVDLRENSETFKKWYGCELSENNKNQLCIPAGFAHGFLTLSDFAEVQYKVNTFYDPMDEKTILWNDEEIGILWPINQNQITLSKKDRNGMKLNEFLNFKELS